MRYKLHSNHGDLMFKVCENEEELYTLLNKHVPERVISTWVSVLVEADTESGWAPLTRNCWLIDRDDGTVETDNYGDVCAACESDIPIRWAIFCDDDPLDYCLSVVYRFVGGGPVVQMH